ncbi:MAG: hypothetical protein PHF35_01040 [Candidatus Moranbacteria bacterium]|nr:hypothetical protein [Candidatus Moranbacteria bacterium]
MPQNIQKIFKNLKNIEPRAGLEKRVLKAISAGSVRKLKQKLLLIRAGIAVSAGFLVYTSAVFGRYFFQSNFWNLGKLAFSDTGVVMIHWKDFLFSLLESLPVAAVVALLAPVFLMMMLSSLYFKFSGNRSKFYQV